MPMEVILLERVDSLGNLGDIVKVKPGYARNYLIPQNKALRATADNVVYFEGQKKEIEKQNELRRKEAEKDVKKLDGLKVAIIRHASETGQLYGSVAARDIAAAVAEKSGLKIARSAVVIKDPFKTLGLFPVSIVLHPEVRVDVTVNIARSEDEAKLQEKAGRALIAETEGSSAVSKAEAEIRLENVSGGAKEAFLEDSALEAEKLQAEEDALAAAEKAAGDEAKAAKKAAKKAAAAEDEAPEVEE